MRTSVYVAIALLASGCGKDETPHEPAPPKTAAQPTPTTETSAKPPKPATKKPSPSSSALDCGGWGFAELLKKHCAKEVALAPSDIIPDSDMACRRQGRPGDGVSIEILVGDARKNGHSGNTERFPSEPAQREDGNKKITRVGAFPYFITISQRSLRGGELACTDAEAQALASALATAVSR